MLNGAVVKRTWKKQRKKLYVGKMRRTAGSTKCEWKRNDIRVSIAVLKEAVGKETLLIYGRLIRGNKDNAERHHEWWVGGQMMSNQEKNKENLNK